MNMNIQRLTALAEWLEAGAPERRFNMNKLLDTDTAPDPSNWCGTTCCIAGYVYTKWVEPIPGDQESLGHTILEDAAAEALGLQYLVAEELFYFTTNATGPKFPWEDVTPQQAAQAVRNVIAYGEPRWKDILGEEHFG